MVSITDVLQLLTKYGAATTIIIALAAVIMFLYKQQIQSLKDSKKEVETRCDRLELEVKALNADLQKYIMTGLMVRQVMNEAATEMSRDDHTGTTAISSSRT
jgi:phage shock protein A